MTQVLHIKVESAEASSCNVPVFHGRHHVEAEQVYQLLLLQGHELKNIIWSR